MLDGDHADRDRRPGDEADGRETATAPGAEHEAKPDAPEDSEEAAKPGLSRRTKLLLSVFGLLALVGGGGWGLQAWLHARLHESTNNAAVQAQTVRVSPMVTGHALKVHVTDNQLVEAGQVLIEIDDRDLAVAVEQARAQLEAARGQHVQAQARVTAAQATVGEARAQVEVAEAESGRAGQDAERYRQLSDLAASQQRKEQIATAARTADSQVEAARRRVASAEAEVRSSDAAVASASAEVRRAEAGLREAELRASYARVTAPFAGHVTQRRVEPGDYVRPGTPILSLVGRERWVEANFKETQLAQMQPGQPARITIDAYPDLELVAQVDSLQRGTGAQFSLLPPQNATGNWVEVVQRLPVKLTLAPGSLDRLSRDVVLAPGLSANVEVRVEREEANPVLRRAGGWIAAAQAAVSRR